MSVDGTYDAGWLASIALEGEAPFEDIQNPIAGTGAYDRLDTERETPVGNRREDDPVWRIRP